MSTSTQSIREIVATHPSATRVFERFDIDLCSQAENSLDRACAELQLSVDQVMEKLATAESEEQGCSPIDPATLSTERLIQHIVRVHHHYVRQELPGLAQMARKLENKRGAWAAELTLVAELLEELRDKMFSHIQKEEQILFPFISQMDQSSIIDYPSAHACFSSVSYPVFMMMQEHESANQIVAELRRLTTDFDAPVWACATHIALLAGLLAFEADLKQHVHLENDVLFPRVLAMEGELKTKG